MEANLMVQLERFSLPMSYYFRMECRRWAPLCDTAGYPGLSLVIVWIVGLTDWTWSMVNVGMRVCDSAQPRNRTLADSRAELWNTQHGNKPNKRSTP
jgi:hypothetical protein